MRRCGFGGGKLFIGIFSWISDQPLTSFWRRSLGHPRPRVLGPCQERSQVGKSAMYLYCTYALFTLPLAVKFDGPLRCIVAVCVVSDEVKRDVTCRLETRAPYSSLTRRACRSVMSKLQCGSSRLVLGRWCVVERGEASDAGWSLTSESRTAHSPQDTITSQTPCNSFSSQSPIIPFCQASGRPAQCQPRPADLDSWTLTR